ncbi:MAG: alpha/beta fold hydrolase [Armatimonadota bacterium]
MTDTPPADRVIFLPGASGDGRFWAPVAARLPYPLDRVVLDWPGFGRAPRDPEVRGLQDLVTLVLDRIDRPVDLVAQSMGGVIAVRVALQRPHMIRHLVLAATSGGIDVSRFGARDWRDEYEEAYPAAPPWFIDDRTDLAPLIPSIHSPTLLIWGDADPISPVAVGEYLARLLPRSRLVVIRGGEHMLGRDRADEVAPFIANHLASQHG